MGRVLGQLDQEARARFYDSAGELGATSDWLSTNLDLQHPADLHSPANQIPIECLVKWMLHSPPGSSNENSSIEG